MNISAPVFCSTFIKFSFMYNTKIHYTFLIFFSFLFHSKAFTPQTNFLLNFGSNTNVKLDNRIFLGDSSVHLTKGKPIELKNPNSFSNLSKLYNSASVFTSDSIYTFSVKELGLHFVRFHFSPFKAQSYDLKNAKFSVTANKVLILTDISVGLTMIKEFLLMVNDTELEILFSPINESSYAFVNGIEVFSAPDDFIIDVDAKLISPDGIKEFNHNLSLQSYETIHRINVGGSKLTPFNDTLWRSWIPDEDFLVLKSAAKIARTTHVPNYQKGGATREIAPDNVYMTAQQMNMDNVTSGFMFNITWDFPVGLENTLHLVRLHFCDIISLSVNQLFFNVYINDITAYKDLDLSAATIRVLASPYYIDFVVDSHKSGNLRISVGPSDLSSSLRKNAILNGVEIMQILNSVSSENAPKKINIALLVGSIVGGTVVIIFVILGILFMLRCRRQKMKPKRIESTRWSALGAYGGSSQAPSHERTVLTTGYITLKIAFSEIQRATNNFDKDLIIGHGGFGTVYKGVLSNNVKVAVKRGKAGSRQGLPEFQTEITILSKIRHQHLVSLVGFCEEQSEMILAYEYVEKGPLKNHLYGSTEYSPLSWKQRLEICIGAARGLHYLHTGFAQGIIHRDIKSTNILLDENYVAKVADFGLSRSGPRLNETHVSTGVKGSFGYLDPEYFRRQQLTDKSDVYSFGVVLFEVVCGRAALDPALAREEVNLGEWALEWQKKGLLTEIVDPHLNGQIKPSSLKRFGEIAEKCLADYGVDRPSMGDVLWNLEYALQLQENVTNGENNFTSLEVQAARAVHRGPSSSMNVEENHGAGISFISSSQVFSQLVNNEGR